MKLRDLAPEIESFGIQNQVISKTLQGFDLINKAQEGRADIYTSPTFGVDYIVNQWVKQHAAFRKRLILDLMVLAENVVELRAPITVITNEVFRKGIECIPKFIKHCGICNKNYEEEIKKCPKCNSTQLTNPDEKQLKRIEELTEDCNIFDQSLEDVLKQFDKDLNVIDDAFLYVAKEYKILDKKIVSKPLEIRRINPALIEYDLDENGVPKNNNWVCMIHRKGLDNEAIIYNKAGVCPECGFELEPAMYIMEHRGKKYYLLDSEICKASKFSPSELYGFSPILTLFEKALTLVGMDKVYFRYFFERKMPPAMLMVFTDDVEGLRREKLNIQRMTKENPDDTPWLAVSAKQGTRGRAELVRLFHSLQEMQYAETKQDIRERIASLWGVSPIWQGALEASGGLSTQTQQLVVTSRAVEKEQRIFNEKVFPFICKAYGITDWDIQLKQPEEKAEQTRLTFMQQRVGAANQLFQMGFDVKLRSGVKEIDDIQFEISGEPKKMEEMFGGGGGLPGGGTEEMPASEKEQSKESSPLFSSQDTWVNQINKSGYTIDDLIKIDIRKSGIVDFHFISDSEPYTAQFSPTGKLRKVKEMVKPKAQIPVHVTSSKGTESSGVGEDINLQDE